MSNFTFNFDNKMNTTIENLKKYNPGRWQKISDHTHITAPFECYTQQPLTSLGDSDEICRTNTFIYETKRRLVFVRTLEKLMLLGRICEKKIRTFFVNDSILSRREADIRFIL